MVLQSLILLLLFTLISGNEANPLREHYGYVEVRPGAHMFWVIYETEKSTNWRDQPLILWLQGGPGASGVGYGNFMEIGPHDIYGQKREYSWTKIANVMFIDNPVGAGYSYVEHWSQLCTNNDQIAQDLVTVLANVFEQHPETQTMPFYVFSESYGGKMTADLALALHKAVSDEKIKCNFRGVGLGDSWIHPMDYVNTWGPFLYAMGMVNKDGLNVISKAAKKTQKAVERKKWSLATRLWSMTENIVEEETFGVDFYNILSEDPSIYNVEIKEEIMNFTIKPELRSLYLRHVIRPNSLTNDLNDFMNGPQAKHWNIPKDVVWGQQSGNVFEYLSGDFMKPVVRSVERILEETDVHVSIYNGDLDLICDTPGTYKWVHDMDYPQKENFEKTKRKPLHIDSKPSNAGYVRRYQKLSLFTILDAGHMVPLDEPEMTLKMVKMIIGYGLENNTEEIEINTPIQVNEIENEKNDDVYQEPEYKSFGRNEIPEKNGINDYIMIKYHKPTKMNKNHLQRIFMNKWYRGY